jgi:hypothetical protein
MQRAGPAHRHETMTNSAGYSGVIVTDVPAGFTSADGYTGVTHSQVASGYTGTIPIATTPSGGDDQATGQGSAPPFSEYPRIMVAPYNRSTSRSKHAPGGRDATDYHPPPGGWRDSGDGVAGVGDSGAPPLTTPPPPPNNAYDASGRRPEPRRHRPWCGSG